MEQHKISKRVKINLFKFLNNIKLKESIHEDAITKTLKCNYKFDIGIKCNREENVMNLDYGLNY